MHIHGHYTVTDGEHAQESVTQVGQVHGPGQGVGPLLLIVGHQEEVQQVIQGP